MKTLKELTKKEYESIKKSGLMWVLFPEATGNYEEDTEHDCTNGTGYRNTSCPICYPKRMF